MGELHLEVLKHRLRLGLQGRGQRGQAAGVLPPDRAGQPARPSTRSSGSSRARTRWRRCGSGSSRPGRAPATQLRWSTTPPRRSTPKFRPAVEEGVLFAAQGGLDLGFPVIDVKATLVGGRTHETDSTEMAFGAAGGRGVPGGLRGRRPGDPRARHALRGDHAGRVRGADPVRPGAARRRRGRGGSARGAAGHPGHGRPRARCSATARRCGPSPRGAPRTRWSPPASARCRPTWPAGSRSGTEQRREHRVGGGPRPPGPAGMPPRGKAADSGLSVGGPGSGT